MVSRCSASLPPPLKLGRCLTMPEIQVLDHAATKSLAFGEYLGVKSGWRRWCGFWLVVYVFRFQVVFGWWSFHVNLCGGFCFESVLEVQKKTIKGCKNRRAICTLCMYIRSIIPWNGFDFPNSLSFLVISGTRNFHYWCSLLKCVANKE